MHTKTVSALILAFTISATALGQPAAAPHAMPPLDRPWTAADFTMAADMIASKEAPLPIYTEGGHPVLDRYLAPENLNALRDPALPAKQRLLAANAIIQADGRLYSAFLEAGARHKIVHVELSQIMAMNLHVAALQARAFEEASAEPGNPLTPELRAQLGQLYVALYDEVAVAAAPKSGFSMGDSMNVLNAAAFYYPRVDGFIDADARAQLRPKFQALRDQAKLTPDVRNLDKLLAAMNH